MSDVSFLFWSLFCFGLLLRAAQNDSYLGLLAFNDFCLVCLAAFLSLFRLCHSVIRREYNSKWSTDESTQSIHISHAFCTSSNGVLGDFVNLLPPPHQKTVKSIRSNQIACPNIPINANQYNCYMSGLFQTPNYYSHLTRSTKWQKHFDRFT